MKLSISNIAWDKSNNDAVYALMQKYGYSGLEIAPTKIILEQPYSHVADAIVWKKDLHSKYGFFVSSLQSIWYGRNEKLFGTDADRKELLDYTKSAIDFASAIGCNNLVFGCPKNRAFPENTSIQEKNQLAESVAVPFFRGLGEYAAEKNTCIGMEANPEIYGTNFVTTTEQAIEFIRCVDSIGFKLNLDVGTMIQNDELVSILHGNEDVINHVHISEPYLRKIQKHQLHKELMNFLKSREYDGYISIEMSLQNSIEDLEEVFKYLSEL